MAGLRFSLSHLIILSALTLLFMENSFGSSSLMDSSTALLIKVDQSGQGDFKTIQAAIDSIPSKNSAFVFISIMPGIYREKIIIPANKPFITLSGTDAEKTTITWKERWIVINAATVNVYATDFVCRNITIKNTFGPSAQAIALRLMADRAAIYNCRLLSYQDTILAEIGRHYFNNCYIEGGTDFICGNGLSLFENCHLHSISQKGGAVTAQRRFSSKLNTGYSFLRCKLTGNGSAILGRPWGAYARTVFLLTEMSDVVLPRGWDDWNDPNKHKTVFYGQYKCSGAGSSTAGRVSWSRKLTDAEAQPFMGQDMIDGQDWLRPAPTKFIPAKKIT